jgi:hypothetical protein
MTARSSATPNGTFVGRLAAVTQLLFGGILGIVASFGFEPGFLPRGAVLLLVFGMPGLVGLIGAQRRKPALLVAASLTSFVGAFIAFSGVTLIFLIPAILFAFGAVAVETRRRAADRPSLGRVLVQLLAAAAIVVLLLGGGASALLVTDRACWAEYPGTGTARIEPFPYTTGEITVPGAATSVGCTAGVISPRGVGLAAVLWAEAIWLALRTSRRSETA